MNTNIKITRCTNFISYTLHIAVFFCWDEPYGLTQEQWDVLPSGAERKMVFKQFQASNTSDHYVAFVWHGWREVNTVFEAMQGTGHQEMTPYYWHKTGHNVPIQQSSWTSSCETGMLGFWPCRQKCDWNTDTDSRRRHNFHECPSVTTYHRDANGAVCNPCQKPIELMLRLAQAHCPPATNAFVAGGAACGEVIGCLEAGCNVVVVEKDRKQYDNCCAILMKYHADILKEASAADKVRQGEADTSGDISATTSASQSNLGASGSTPQAPELPTLKCGDCGLPFEADEVPEVCVDSRCGASARYHSDCMRPREEDQVMVCQEHVCGEGAWDSPLSPETN